MKLVTLSAILVLYILAAAAENVASLQLTSQHVKQVIRASSQPKAPTMSPLYQTNTSTVFNASQIAANVGDRTYKQCDAGSITTNVDFIKSGSCVACLQYAVSTEICDGCCVSGLSDVR